MRQMWQREIDLCFVYSAQLDTFVAFFFIQKKNPTILNQFRLNVSAESQICK